MRLRIRLHIDGLSVLNYIKGRLGVGSIEISDNSATLVFYTHDVIKNVIIPIFEEFPLNSRKYLNYLDFKKAFLLYVAMINRVKQRQNRPDNVINEILLLKTNMNFGRTNFEMPKDHIINITPC
jgi:hypothetical protein